MRYLIIGLGIYGTNLAKDLTDMGHEVIGADTKAANVDAIKDYISTAYILDSTDEAAIGVLPLKNVDIVIVAIGENFGASIKTVALLRKLGVRNLYARAIDELHRAILEGMQVERIVTPEQRAANDLVHEMELGSEVETLRIDGERYAMRFSAPEYFFSMRYRELTTDKMFGLQFIAASRPGPSKNVLGVEARKLTPINLAESPDERVSPGDIFTCLGTAKHYRNMFRHIN